MGAAESCGSGRASSEDQPPGEGQLVPDRVGPGRPRSQSPECFVSLKSYICAIL